MLSRARALTFGCALAGCALVSALPGSANLLAQTDLDAFMREVLAARDENWKKLQQYVLDERENIDMRGPGHAPIWGERRDYTWFIRDGFFVRSPLKINGVTISDADRRKYEGDFLNRQQRRERRRENNQPADPPPADVEGLLKQTREPAFISSAYFLRFRFEEGKYALVGRERFDLPGGGPPHESSPGSPAGSIDVLRIEYYPTNLFRMTDRRRDGDGRGASEKDKAYDAEFRRLMNKTALITLWVEPNARQIVKYTFDNISFDFLPAQWLLHVDDLHASMTMGQPFPDVWLPSTLQFQAAATLAVGQFDVRYALEYHDYRRADVTTKVTVPKGR